MNLQGRLFVSSGSARSSWISTQVSCARQACASAFPLSPFTSSHCCWSDPAISSRARSCVSGSGPTGTFVDFEHGLNAVVNRLRETLGDSADRPRFIETVPRRGYRFIAPVDSGPKHKSATHTRPSGWDRAGRLIWPAVVIALAIGAAVSLFVFRLRPISRPPMRATPLTSLPGQERYPSFSPDGNQIAFAWDGENGDNQDIYIKVVGAAVPLRLTTHPAADQKPIWSSDGRHIAFVRLSDEGGGLFMIPALGGPERKIGSMIPEHEWAAGPSWSPDGKLLAFSERPEAQAPLSIFLASIESLEKRKLTSPPVGSVGDCAPAISPDGRTGGLHPGQRRRWYLPRPGCRRGAYTCDARARIRFVNASPGRPTGASWCFRPAPAAALPNRVAVSGESPRRAGHQNDWQWAAITRRIQPFQAGETGSRMSSDRRT